MTDATAPVLRRRTCEMVFALRFRCAAASGGLGVRLSAATAARVQSGGFGGLSRAGMAVQLAAADAPCERHGTLHIWQ